MVIRKYKVVLLDNVRDVEYTKTIEVYQLTVTRVQELLDDAVILIDNEDEKAIDAYKLNKDKE